MVPNLKMLSYIVLWVIKTSGQMNVTTLMYVYLAVFIKVKFPK